MFWIHYCMVKLSVQFFQIFIVHSYGLIWASSWQNQQNDCAPNGDSDQPGHLPSLIRVFTVHMKKPWVLSYPLRAQQRLWSDWAYAQADLSLRWAHNILLVLSWGSSFISLCRLTSCDKAISMFLKRLPAYSTNHVFIAICQASHVIVYFLTHGTRISLSMAVWDFSVSACLSHPRIKFLSQTVNHCYM